METYVINKPEDLEKFAVDGGFRIDGHVIIMCDLTIAGFLRVVGSIKASDWIKAGGSIEAGEYVFSFLFSIKATALITSRLPFWREFWAEMPPLKKWREQILDDNKCWGDYKGLMSAAEAREVCKWEGWHPILRAQLEMFLGLKKQVKWNKE